MDNTSLVNLSKIVADSLKLEGAFIANVIYTLIAFFAYLITAYLLHRIFKTKFENHRLYQSVRSTIRLAMMLLLIGILLNIWVVGEGGLGSYLGIGGDFFEPIVDSINIGLFYFGARRAIKLGLNFTSSDTSKHYALSKSLNIALITIVVILIAKTWLGEGTSLSTYLGLLSAGLAIALQDIIASLAGWFYLLLVRPFWIGQRIQVGDSIGDVIDIGFFQFALMELGNLVDADQPTGRILHFPNSQVFKNKIANYNAGFDFIWNDISVMITFESDWRKAEGILTTIVKKHSLPITGIYAQQYKSTTADYRISHSDFEPRVWLSVGDSGVVWSLRFVCQPNKMRTKIGDIWRDVLEAFEKEPKIDLAYPTTRFFTNNIEAHPDLRPYS